MHAKVSSPRSLFTVEGDIVPTMQKSNERCICLGSEQLDSSFGTTGDGYLLLELEFRNDEDMPITRFYEFKLYAKGKRSSWKEETETTSASSHLIISCDSCTSALSQMNCGLAGLLSIEEYIQQEFIEPCWQDEFSSNIFEELKCWALPLMEIQDTHSRSHYCIFILSIIYFEDRSKSWKAASNFVTIPKDFENEFSGLIIHSLSNSIKSSRMKKHNILNNNRYCVDLYGNSSADNGELWIPFAILQHDGLDASPCLQTNILNRKNNLFTTFFASKFLSDEEEQDASSLADMEREISKADPLIIGKEQMQNANTYFVFGRFSFFSEGSPLVSF